MSRRKKEGPKLPFSIRKAARSSAVHAGTGATFAALLAVGTGWLLVEPVSGMVVLTEAGKAALEMGLFAFAGEYVIHKLDDPVFDTRTTILFDLTGLTFGLLLFVIPALQLEATIRPGIHLPGALTLLVMGILSFAIVLLRGLLMNLGIVRDGESAERDRLPS